MFEAKYNFKLDTLVNFSNQYSPARTYIHCATFFFILNKGLNCGKPLSKTYLNCLVITTSTKVKKEALYYLCLSLKVDQYFAYYLKETVIPFIRISYDKKVINTALQNYETEQWLMKVQKLKKITAFEENLKQQLSTNSKIKIVLLRS